MNHVQEELYEVIMQQFEGFSIKNFLFWAIVGVLVIEITVILYEYKRREKGGFFRKFWLGLFVVYLDFLFQITCFRREPGSRIGIATSINEIFLLWRDAKQILYQFLNIVLFLPFGALLTMILKKIQGWRCVLLIVSLSYLCSLVIEVTQMLSGRGYFEAADLLMNVLGGVLGCLIMNTLIKIRKQ